MISFPPLMEFMSLKRGGSLLLLAFGTVQKENKIIIPISCVKSNIKKNQILKYKKFRFKILENCDVHRDSFTEIQMILHKELK